MVNLKEPSNPHLKKKANRQKSVDSINSITNLRDNHQSRGNSQELAEKIEEQKREHRQRLKQQNTSQSPSQLPQIYPNSLAKSGSSSNLHQEVSPNTR